MHLPNLSRQCNKHEIETHPLHFFINSSVAIKTDSSIPKTQCDVLHCLSYFPLNASPLKSGEDTVDLDLFKKSSQYHSWQSTSIFFLCIESFCNQKSSVTSGQDRVRRLVKVDPAILFISLSFLVTVNWSN